MAMFPKEVQRAIRSVREGMVRLGELLRKATFRIRETVSSRDLGSESLGEFFRNAFSEDPAVRDQTLSTLYKQIKARLNRLRLPNEGIYRTPPLKKFTEKRALRNLRYLLDDFFPTFSGKWNPLNLLVFDAIYSHDRGRFNEMQKQLSTVVETNLESSREVLAALFPQTDEQALTRFQNFALLAGLLLPGKHSGVLPTQILRDVSILAISDLFNYSGRLKTQEAEVGKIYALSGVPEFCHPEQVKKSLSFLLLREFSTQFFSCLDAFGFRRIQESYKLRAIATLFEKLLGQVEDLKNQSRCADTISEVCERLNVFVELPEFHKVRTIVERIQSGSGEKKA